MRKPGRLLQPEEMKAFRNRESWAFVCPSVERNGKIIRWCDHVLRLHLPGHGSRARKPAIELGQLRCTMRAI